jgi:F0F1-type ATP synthase assembly protein I
LDQWLGTQGIFVTVFTILGIIGGGVVVYRQIMDVVQDKEKEKRGPDGEID